MIERAIANGESNWRTMELVRNWCAHVKVQKFGGVGIVEHQTGLPIGPHSLTCPHASAPGFAAADLAAAAVDFHDRNCVGCPNRKPVRLPNLSTLLQKREAARAVEAAEDARREAECATQQAARDTARQVLRANLGPLSSDVVDQIEELDRSRDRADADRLVQTAKLAPDVFTPPLVEYAFGLLEGGESWFDDAGLGLLKALNANPTRVTRCALICLSRHGAEETAIAILLENLRLADETLIADALPNLISLANPRRLPLSGGDREPVAAPLLRLHETFGAAVETAIAGLLDAPEPDGTSQAARGIAALARRDKALPGRYARTLVSKLVRDHRLLETDECHDRNGETVSEVRHALGLAFEASPAEVDELLSAFMLGASEVGEARIFSVYREVLRPRFDSGEVTEANRVALKRVIWHATRTDRKEVLREIQHVISGGRFGFASLAAEEVEGLLGAAILIDNKLERLESAPPLHDPTILTGLERYNQQILLEQLREGFVRWAAAGASETPAAARAYSDVLGELPTEGRGALKIAMVRQLDQLMQTTDGLNAALPHLYTAMVGASVALRANAAHAIGELGVRQQDNAPSLVFEAFTALLLDPYKAVHQAAVHALRRLYLPETFAPRIRSALAVLIACYAEDREGDRFLVECLQLYVDRYAKPDEFSGKRGDRVLSRLLEIEPYAVADKIICFARMLQSHDRFVPLLARLVRDSDAWHGRYEVLTRLLADLPSSTVRRQLETLEALAHAPEVRGRNIDGLFIEIFTRAGAWEAAARLAHGRVTVIPDDAWNRTYRLAAQQLRVAVDFEAALAAGALDRACVLSAEWKTMGKAVEEDRIENEERRDPFWGLLGQNRRG
jgi:hypothetical protein